MGKIITDNSGFIKTQRQFDEAGKIITKSSQDIGEILEANKRAQNDPEFNNGYTPEGDMKHVARVPLVVWQHWWKEECERRGKRIPIYGKEMQSVIRKKLNDPDNKFLRTGGGELGKGGEV